MKKPVFALAVCLASGIGYSYDSFSQERPKIPLAREVKGSESPEEISFNKKFRMFVANYDTFSRVEVASAISPQDMALIDGLVGTSETLATEAYQASNTKLQSLCQEARLMDVADVAKRFVALGVEQNEIESASYKSSIDALTPEGRELLYRYIDERITPGMSTSIPNADVVAEIDPETFWFNFDLQCHISIHGSLPEEMLETPYEYNGPTGLEVIEK